MRISDWSSDVCSSDLKRPHADMPNEVEVQLGSDAMKQVAFDIGGALNENGTVLYRLTALARNSDNFVDYIHDDRYYFAPALTWKPDEANELTVLARWQKADTKNGAGFLPAVEIGRASCRERVCQYV